MKERGCFILAESSKIITFYFNRGIKNFIYPAYFKIDKIKKKKKEILDSSTIPKFINRLDKPYIYHAIPVKKQFKSKTGSKKIIREYLYFINITEFDHQILPEGFPKTPVIGCTSLIKESKTGKIRYAKMFPGGTFEVLRNSPVSIRWGKSYSNIIKMYLPGFNKTEIPEGKKYERKIDRCKNNLIPAIYWYHAKDTEGKNKVYNGPLGFYLIKANKNQLYNIRHVDFPADKYIYPLIIQDCSFYTDGSFVLPDRDEKFFGDAIIVNGKVWPNLNVERRQYRFYILNASHSRVYNLKLSNGMDFILVGREKGLLASPVKSKEILLAPGERADVLIDFSRIPTGTKILMINDAKTPYPNGDLPDPKTTGQILRFTVPENEILSIAPMKLPEKFL